MKKKNLFLLLPLLGLVGGFAFSSIHVLTKLVSAGTEVHFDDVYYTNEEIKIPDLQIDVGGKTYDGVKYVVYPNGRTYQKDAFTPSEMGFYTISYRAAGTQKDYEIYVAKNKYYVTGDGSATWTAHPKTPNKESLVVTLAAGSVFHFDEIINLKELGATRNLFSFYPVTADPGAVDANTLKIRFTDVYDESSYFQFEIDASRQGYAHNTVYMRVGGDNQVPTGIEAALNKVHSGTIFGYPYNCNFYCCTPTLGKYTEREYISNRIGLFFDYDNMRGLSLVNSNGHDLICDLDDSEYFSEFWGGMTTSECKVSAWFENMMAPTATICITNIGEKALESKTLIDDAKPNLEIDELFAEMPNAILNQKYRFLEARGLDQYSGEVGAEIHVYRDYYNEKIEVAHSEDGFIPTRIGKYYIEYSATDYSKNRVEKLYEINCVNEPHDYNLSLVSGYPTNGFVGENIILASASVTGSIGPAFVKTYITTPSGNTEEVDGKYTPLAAGSYVVKFEAVDFVGTTKTVSYNLNITVSQAPIMNEEPQLLPYYIAGFEYDLPLVKGIDFTKDSHPEVVSKIKVNDGGAESITTNGKFTFSNSSAQVRDVTLSYICENEKSSNTKNYQIKVVTTTNDAFIHMDRYWIGTNATATASSSEITIASNTSGSAVFANNLAANAFEMNFLFRASTNNFDKFNIYLRDSLNDAEKIKITYYPTADIPEVVVNDDFDFIYKGNGLFNGGSQFITYNNSTFKIQTNTNVVIPVKNYINGEKFKGFSSGSVYLTAEFDNPSNNSVAFSLLDINGQEMSSTKYDYIRPRVVMSDDYGGSKNINEIVNLCSATPYDVLDPNPKVSLSAFNENNEYLNDIKGNPIRDVACDVSYQFKVNNYGLYRVSYHVTDCVGNTSYFTYVITVYDKIAPTIAFKESNPTSAKVGEKVKFVDAYVSDNLTATENIQTLIYVMLPTGQMQEAKDGSYTFTVAGKHTVRYMALDEAQNISVVDFYIDVSEVK